MLKYILFTFILGISTPSFCASRTFSNNSLSMNYDKKDLKNNNNFLNNKLALLANKLNKKKKFPFFGIGSLVAFLIACGN